MRGLAEVAIARGYRQESLAKALAQRPGLSGIQAGNVSRHFRSRSPRRETLDDYAAVLGITDEQLYVIEHGTLPTDQEQPWEDDVFRLLAISQAELTPGVSEAVGNALRADPAARSRALAAHARSHWYPSFLPGPREWAKVPHTLSDFAQALSPRLDLRDFLRKRTAEQGVLFALYLDARIIYKDEKARALVDVCAAVLRLDGFDTEPMYEDFHAELRGFGANLASRKKGDQA